jgi:hypothetical protein
VLRAETWNYPSAPLPRLENGLINGIFADAAELEAYKRGLKQLPTPEIALDENGYPDLPACLDRRACR